MGEGSSLEVGDYRVKVFIKWIWNKFLLLLFFFIVIFFFVGGRSGEEMEWDVGKRGGGGN